MIRAAALASIALAAAAVPPAARAQVLEPRGEWRLTTGESVCRAARSFGPDDAQMALFVEKHAPGGNFQASVIGADLPRDNRKARNIAIGFDGEETRQIAAINARAGDMGMLTFQLTGQQTGSTGAWRTAYVWSGERPAHFDMPLPADARSLTVQAPAHAAATLETGPLDEPLAFLEQCARSLAAEQEPDALSVARPPVMRNVNDAARIMRQPDAWKVARASTLIHWRLLVDEEGRVEDCAILAPQFDESWQRRLCREMAGALRFDPARDAAGAEVSAPVYGSSMALIYD